MELIIQEAKAYPVKVENFGEVKTWLNNSLEKYRNLAFSDDEITAAKKDKATLNAFRTALEEKRKEVKRICLAPYEEFEKQIKELVAMVDAPLSEIDSQVKKFEEMEKSAKLEIIRGYYESAFDELGTELIPLEKFFNERWLNKTYPIKDIESEIIAFAAQSKRYIEILEAKEEFSAELVAKYCETLSFGAVLEHEQRLIEQKKQLEQKKNESQINNQVSQTQATSNIKSQSVQPTVSAGTNFNESCNQEARTPTGYKTLTLRFTITEDQIQALREFVKTNKISAEVVK